MTSIHHADEFAASSGWARRSGAPPRRRLRIAMAGLLVTLAIGVALFLALIVAPSAGAAGGCGGG